jgi:hypothetical protein
LREAASLIHSPPLLAASRRRLHKAAVDRSMRAGSSLAARDGPLFSSRLASRPANTGLRYNPESSRFFRCLKRKIGISQLRTGGTYQIKITKEAVRQVAIVLSF